MKSCVIRFGVAIQKFSFEILKVGIMEKQKKQAGAELCQAQGQKLQLMKLNLELKLKLTTTSPVGGWTETKLMLSQLKLKLYLKLELSLAIINIKSVCLLIFLSILYNIFCPSIQCTLLLLFSISYSITPTSSQHIGVQRIGGNLLRSALHKKIIQKYPS